MQGTDLSILTNGRDDAQTFLSLLQEVRMQMLYLFYVLLDHYII